MKKEFVKESILYQRQLSLGGLAVDCVLRGMKQVLSHHVFESLYSIWNPSVGSS